MSVRFFCWISFDLLSVITLKIPHKLSPEFLELKRENLLCFCVLRVGHLRPYICRAERVMSSWTVLSEGNELDCSSLPMCRNRNGGSSSTCRLFVKSISILVQRFLKAFAIQLLGVANLKVEILYKLRMKEMHHRRANRFISVKLE